MTVKVGIVALAEYYLILFVCPLRVMQTVGGIEMFFSEYGYSHNNLKKDKRSIIKSAGIRYSDPDL